MIREYTWGSHFDGGIGGLLALNQNGNTYSYLYDGKGNVVSVIDSLQAEAVRYRYNSFGKLVNSAGTLQQPFGFSTKRYSDTLGVNYYGYRFYNPQIERWMNRDPLGEAGGINLYEFVGGNPVNWVDPDGLYWMWIGRGIMALATGSAVYSLSRSADYGSEINSLLSKAQGELFDESAKKCPDWKYIEALRNYIDFLKLLKRYYSGQGVQAGYGVAEPGSNVPIWTPSPSYIILPTPPWSNK